MSKKNRTMAERLDQFQNAMEDMLEKEAKQEGFDWELFDISYEGQGVYAVKFGIYPWGTTITEGTLEDLHQTVKEIVREINNAYWFCPYCQKKLNWREMTGDKKCSCGAWFEISSARGYSDESPHDNNVWERISAQVEKQCQDQDTWKIYETLVESGAAISQLFNNVAYAGKVFGWPTYALRGEPGIKPLKEIAAEDPINALRLVLIEMGFELIWVDNDDENWGYLGNEFWEGEIDGKIFKIGLRSNDIYSCLLVVLDDDDSIESKWNDDMEKEYEIFDKWNDYLCDNNKEGDYIIESLIRFGEYDMGSGFYLDNDAVPYFTSISEAEQWLTDNVRNGLAAYRKKAARFLKSLGLPENM